MRWRREMANDSTRTITIITKAGSNSNISEYLGFIYKLRVARVAIDRTK